jgi:hypothetical protein
MQRDCRTSGYGGDEVESAANWFWRFIENEPRRTGIVTDNVVGIAVVVDVSEGRRRE